jgi:hypothetical protein
MPTYTLRNTETQEIFEKTLKIAEYVKYMTENSNIERYYNTSPLVCDPTRLLDTKISKGDPVFQRAIIDRMKASIPGNTLGNSRRFSSPREW